MIKRVYVWEFPVRLTHWLNFLSILVLAVTGLYVGSPFLFAIHEDQFIMAQMRFAHFIAAYVFTASFLLRIYWMFAGNRFSHWDQFIPVSRERIENLFGTTAYYCFLREKCPHVIGHTGIAGATYLFMFLVFLAEIITGFALYSQSHVGVTWTIWGGWLLSVLNVGVVRLIHHLIMYVIAVFVIVHVYISWHNDIAERTGLTSSIFSGYKSIEE
ncbi:MAG: Ni/Fe-hydrogenase, b-type cytochrome subunit [Nitrospirae bacterium]|nr:Ni/Fe-hydrogenase, b-type cytochrome subunit [Nitrospirota bacterium]